ncbi:MAG: hypothetical protein ACRC6I_13490, partial [Paracoccaceae bacterium]
MKLAVTPLLIVIGTTLLAHLNVSSMLDIESCIYAAGYRNNPQTYWGILSDELLGASGPVRLAFLMAAFLPFMIAAAFIRAPTKLYCQWAGLGIVMAAAFLLFRLDQLYQEPGWCLQPDMTD